MSTFLYLPTHVLRDARYWPQSSTQYLSYRPTRPGTDLYRTGVPVNSIEELQRYRAKQYADRSSIASSPIADPSATGSSTETPGQYFGQHDRSTADAGASTGAVVRRRSNSSTAGD
eukprot:484219-Rhodomonas_salina.5